MLARNLLALNFVALSILWTPLSHALTEATVVSRENVLHQYVVRIDREGQFECSGVVIGPHTILTAAHCVLDEDHRKTWGLEIVFDVNGRQVRRPVVKTVASALYEVREPSYGASDIGMAFFSGSLPQGYTPAKVITDISEIPNDRSVVLAGYGATELADDAQRPLGKSDGSGVLRMTLSSIINNQYSQTEMSIGLGEVLQRASCSGDSGGPVFIVRENGERVVVGVVSSDVTHWSRKRKKIPTCAITSSITKVTSFTNWIPENMRKFEPKR